MTFLVLLLAAAALVCATAEKRVFIEHKTRIATKDLHGWRAHG